MTSTEGNEPICRALLDIVHSVRGLAARARGIHGLAAQSGHPMDPMVIRSKQLIEQLESAGETMAVFEDRDTEIKIERDHNVRGDEKIVIRCVQNVMKEAASAEELLPDGPAERVDLRGTSWSVGVPEVLGFLESLGKSGTLTITTFSENFAIVLEQGKVVHASSDESPVGLRLGDILVQQGATTPEKLRQFLKTHAQTDGSIGEAALMQGVVTREQLQKALEFQVQQLFYRVFSARDATFCFYDGNTNSPNVSVRMNLTRLLLESSVEAEERSLRL